LGWLLSGINAHQQVFLIYVPKPANSISGDLPEYRFTVHHFIFEPILLERFWLRIGCQEYDEHVNEARVHRVNSLHRRGVWRGVPKFA
jgi:hypothetical protein